MANTSGINVGVGYRALDANTTGTSNVAVGVDALGAETLAGDQSVAIGHEALLVQNPSGNADMNNVAVGYRAGYAVTTGANNNLIGAGAGWRCDYKRWKSYGCRTRGVKFCNNGRFFNWHWNVCWTGQYIRH